MDNKLTILIKGKLDTSDLSQAKIDQQLKNLRINLKSTLDLSQQAITKFKQDIDKLSKSVKINLQVTVDQASINNAQRSIQTSMSRLTSANNNSTNILNAQDIENQVKRINNSLDRLKINKDKVFADSRVSTEVAKLREMESAFKRGEISARQYGLQLDTLRTRVAQVSGEFRNTNKDGYAFSEMLTLAAKKIAIWGISTNLVYGSLNQLKKGISFISELDNSLNQVRIVTGKTQVEVEKLAQSYNKLGKEMSVSTKEIASTSADLYRQGLSDSDVEERMKSIIQYAKISSISLKESNTIITATANATGESVNKIIDIFALLGDTTASGADEIGEALQRVASASESSNISLEKSASWLATISSITRESASTIGRSLNSAISRYESIKSTGFNSEDSTKLNDVVQSLSDIGIKATDSQGQLLDFANVMDMVGARFDTLSKNEKAYITTTMFGTFQRNRGLTLLNNYSDSLKNYENALNASGTSEQKFAIYQESTGARLERLKASWESFWQSSLDSGVIKGLIDATTILIDTFGNLSTIIMSVVTVLALWKGTAITSTIMAWVVSTKTLNIALADNIRYMIIAKGEALGWTTAQVNAAIATNGLRLALNGLKVAFLSNPIGVIAVVLTTAIGLFDIFSSRIEATSQKQKQVVDDLIQSINKLKSETKEIPNLISTYEELSKVTLKTTEQKDKLSTATAKLSSLFEGSITGFTAEGQAAELDIAYIKQLTEQKENRLKTQQKSLATTFDKSGTDSLKKLQDDQKEMDSLNKKLESYKINMEKMSSGETPSLNREKGIQDYKDMIDGVAKQKAILEATIQSETATFITGAVAVDQLSDSTNKLSKSMQNDLIASLVTTKGSMNDFASATTALESINITKTISDITTHMNEMSKEGKSTTEIQDYLKNSLNGVGEQLTKLGVPIPIVIELIKRLNNDFTLPEVQKATEKILGVAKAIEEVDSSTEKYLKNSEDLASTVAKMNEGHKLTTQELYKLIKAHPELIDAITKENGVLSLNKDAIESVMNANDIAFKSKLESDKVELENQKNLLMKKLYLYGQDIKGIKSVAEAKRIVSEQFNSAASLADPEVRSIYQKNQSVLGDLQAIEDQLKTIGVVSQITPKDLVSASSPSLNKKEKEEKELSIESTTQALINQIQQEYLLQKAKSDSIQKDLSQVQSQKDYQKQLELTNSLISNQQIEIQQLGLAKSKLEAEFSKVSSSSGFSDTSLWLDPVSGEATLAYLSKFNSSTKEMQEKLSSTFDALQKLQKAWKDNSTAVQGLTTSQKSLQQSLQDLISTQADEAVEAFKKSLEEQKKLDDDAYDKKIKKLDSAHQKVLDNLDEELSAQEDAINSQIDLIDKLADAEDYNKNLTTAQSERQKIQDQINILSRDTSSEGKARLAELQAQLAEKNSSIEDMQNTNTRNLRKQNLQDNLDSIKKEIDAQRQAENEKYNATKDRLAREKQAEDDNYTAMMASEQTFAGLRKAIIEGNITDINIALTEFNEGFTKDLTSKAEQIDKSFQTIIKTINQIKSVADSIPEIPINAKGTNSHPGGLAVFDDAGRELVTLPNGKSFIGDNGGAKLANFPEGTKILPNNLTEQFIKKLGIPGYASGIGVTDILKNIDLSSILKNMPSILPNISLPSLQFPQLQPSIATTSNITIPQINFNITSTDGVISKKELDRAANYTIKKIENAQTIRGR